MSILFILFFIITVIIAVPIILIQNKASAKKRAAFMAEQEKAKATPSASVSSPVPVPVVPASVASVPRNPSVRYLSKPDPSSKWPDEHYSDILAMRDFCVLDVETTGLECWSCRVVQIGIIKVVDNQPVDCLNTYINPETHIPTNATAIHGITDADVADAPTYKQIADRVIALLNNTTVVGHNVTFDLNFVQHILIEGSDPNSNINIDYVDTWEYANRVLPGMPNYKLQTLLQFYNIDPGTAHTAYDDARATLELFNALRYEYSHKDELEARRREAEKQARKEKKEAEKEARRAAFSSSPLFDVRICFTGEFSIPRESMEALALSVGAMVQQKGVTSRTNYLVKGDLTGLPDWALDRKLHKADELIASGKSLRIIDEAEYMGLISEAKATLAQKSEDGDSP